MSYCSLDKEDRENYSSQLALQATLREERQRDRKAQEIAAGMEATEAAADYKKWM